MMLYNKRETGEMIWSYAQNEKRTNTIGNRKQPKEERSGDLGKNG